MKTLLGEYLRLTIVVAYTLLAWPLAAALAKLLGQRAPGALEIAASRFGWTPAKGGG